MNRTPFAGAPVRAGSTTYRLVAESYTKVLPSTEDRMMGTSWALVPGPTSPAMRDTSRATRPAAARPASDVAGGTATPAEPRWLPSAAKLTRTGVELMRSMAATLASRVAASKRVDWFGAVPDRSEQAVRTRPSTATAAAQDQ